MSHQENQKELKEEELLLRSLLTGSPSSARAQEILNLTFTPHLIRWSMEDVHMHLREFYNFSNQEVEKIIDNYPIEIPVRAEVFSHSPPLPIFQANDEKVIAYAQALDNASQKLTETKKELSKNELNRGHYQTEEDFNKAIAERANLQASFLEIRKFIDKERENAHLQMQPPC